MVDRCNTTLGKRGEYGVILELRKVDHRARIRRRNHGIHAVVKKPKSEGGNRGYKDYYEKIETYVEEVGGEAEAKRPGILLRQEQVGIQKSNQRQGSNT